MQEQKSMRKEGKEGEGGFKEQSEERVSERSRRG